MSCVLLHTAVPVSVPHASTSSDDDVDGHSHDGSGHNGHGQAYDRHDGNDCHGNSSHMIMHTCKI
jgi:hypothetical protein